MLRLPGSPAFAPDGRSRQALRSQISDARSPISDPWAGNPFAPLPRRRDVHSQCQNKQGTTDPHACQENVDFSENTEGSGARGVFSRLRSWRGSSASRSSRRSTFQLRELQQCARSGRSAMALRTGRLLWVLLGLSTLAVRDDFLRAPTNGLGNGLAVLYFEGSEAGDRLRGEIER